MLPGSIPELGRPYIADGSNVENCVTVEPHLPYPNKQHKNTPVPSSSLPPATKDGTNKTYVSIVSSELFLSKHPRVF
jgi:hypothetical protein